jgi:hypothetical protein
MRRLLITTVLASLIACGLAASPAGADDPQTSTVSGTVSRADGRSPEGIEVVTRCNGGLVSPDPTYTTTVAADGSYSLPTPALPSADPYARCSSTLVEFHDPTGTYLSQFYDDALTDDAATLVPAAPGDTALAPQLLSRAAGAIRGRVVDSYGHPVTDDAIRVRVYPAGNELDGAVPWTPGTLDSRGGYVLRSLPAGRYIVETTRHGSPYWSGTTGAKKRIRVTAGQTTTAPRVVVKDRSHIRARATWHARSVTLRIQVTSRVTGRPVDGRISAYVLHGGKRLHVRLHRGRAVVTLAAGPAAREGGWGISSVRYAESRHAGRSQGSWQHEF